jgi:hypothetical protein
MWALTLAGCGGDDAPAPEPEPPAPARTCAWGQRVGAPGEQEALAVATDASGNVFIAGTFSGSLDFLGSPLMSAGGAELFVAKLDPGGRHLWSKSCGDADGTVAIDVDAEGNLLLAGSFQTEVNFGIPLGSLAGTNVFIAKLDPEGEHVWSRRFGDNGNSIAEAMAVDGAGNLIITGAFDGVLNFGPGALAAQGERDVFVAKFDPSGAPIWASPFGRTGDQNATSLVVGPSDTLVLSGYFDQAIDFGGGDLEAADTAAFVAKLDGDGGHVWSQPIGPLSRQDPHLVAIDSTGAVFASGPFDHTIDFEGGSISGAGLGRVYLVKLDADGAFVWAKHSSGDATLSLAADGQDHAIIGVRGALHEYDASGNAFPEAVFGDPDSMGGTAMVAIPSSLAVDGDDNLLFAGSVLGSVACGTEMVTSAGGADVFVAKLAPSAPED